MPNSKAAPPKAGSLAPAQTLTSVALAKNSAPFKKQKNEGTSGSSIDPAALDSVPEEPPKKARCLKKQGTSPEFFLGLNSHSTK